MPDPAPIAKTPLTPEEYEAERMRVENERSGSNGNGVVDFPAARPLSVVRELPRSIEAEENLISTCLMPEDEGAVLRHARDAGIRPETFYVGANQIIFGHLIGMADAKKPITLDVLAEELKTAKQFDAVDGYRYLTQITSKVPTTAQASYFIEKVREQALLREVIRASTSAVEDAYNFTGGIDEFLALQQARVTPIFRQLSTAKKGLTVWTPAQFRAWTPPMELNLLGAGYLRRRQITTLIGPPGVGKSRLSLWMGVCHIAGRPCAGLDPKGGTLRWLYVGNENDPERQKRDLDFFYRNLTAEDQAKVDANLFLHVLETHEDAQMTLADSAAYNRLAATLKAVKPDVFVCDPWGNMIETNENDNEEVRRTLKLLLRAVAEGSPDSAILIIHHARTGKANAIEAGNNYSGGNLGRGSKVLVSQARCELALWPGDSEDSSKLVLTCEKVNNAPKFEPVGLNFDNGIYGVDSTFSVKAWRDDIEGKMSGKTVTISDIIACITHGTHRTKDICSELENSLGASRATVNRRIKEAKDGGWITETEPRGSFVLSAAARERKGGKKDEPAARDITATSVEPSVIEKPHPSDEELPFGG